MREERVLDPESRATPPERAGNIVLAALIIVNVVAVIFETVEPLRERWGEIFVSFETFSVAVFTVEYGLRFWSCVESPRFAHPILGRLRYVLSAPAIIDAVAIAPAYMPGEVFLDSALREGDRRAVRTEGYMFRKDTGSVKS